MHKIIIYFLFSTFICNLSLYSDSLEITPQGNLIKRKPPELTIKFKNFGIDWKSTYPIEELLGVELYYSVNKGKTWKLYKFYKSPKGPLPVKVTANGTYSFYTRAIGKKLSEEAPEDDTSPKVIVNVKA